MDLDNLEQLIDKNLIDDAVELIKEIGRNRDLNAVPLLIKILEETDNHGLRNTVAIALSDIGSNDAVEPIIRMLKDTKTIGHRGTLVYSLETLDYSKHIDLLVEFVCEGNYEVKIESLQLITAVKKNLTQEQREKFIHTINDKIEKLEEQLEFLYHSIDEIKNEKNNKAKLLEKLLRILQFIKHEKDS